MKWILKFELWICQILKLVQVVEYLFYFEIFLVFMLIEIYWFIYGSLFSLINTTCNNNLINNENKHCKIIFWTKCMTILENSLFTIIILNIKCNNTWLQSFNLIIN